MTEDEADFKILGMANERDKFGLDVRGIDDPNLQQAFERGIDHNWFTLVDVSFVAAYPGVLMRVFKLTDGGRYRLNLLKETLHV